MQLQYLCDYISTLFIMKKTRNTLIALVACIMTAMPLSAQRNEIYSDQIRTLQVIANNDWQAMPVIEHRL